jgi:hypothetical protein
MMPPGVLLQDELQKTLGRSASPGPEGSVNEVNSKIQAKLNDILKELRVRIQTLLRPASASSCPLCRADIRADYNHLHGR